MANSRVVVALATYNERDNLAALIAEIRSTVPAADVLIMDDHSPDGTGILAEELAVKDRQIYVIHRAGKLGLGTALLGIMQFAIDRQYDVLVTMDADHSHQPRYLPAILRGMDDADVTIGSRYVPGGGTENWPWSRQMMSRSTGLLVRCLLGIPARDTSGNYRGYRVSLLKRANLTGLLSRGYSFQQEMLYRCCLAGARIAETPIVFVERRAGHSKAGLKEKVTSLAALLRLGWRAQFQRASMMPVADFDIINSDRRAA